MNFGVFDENVRYRFDLETTGDAREDVSFDIRFSPRQTAAGMPQTATIVTSFRDTVIVPMRLQGHSPKPRLLRW